MMTATTALEAGTVTRTTRIKDVGTLRLDGGEAKIDNADRKGMGWVTFEDGIAYSRNVVAAKVALGLSDTTAGSSAMVFDTWRKLGYGARTGIDVAGEVGGLLRDPANKPWAEIDLANAAFGQGVAVTPIQLASAFATIINGGTTVKPHVVQGIGSHDVAVAPGNQVVKPAVAKKVRKLMDHVVKEVPFYRDRTIVPGYHVGGKTGTAQIWDAKANKGRGAWKHNLFNYSFVGYIAPQERHAGPRGRRPHRRGHPVGRSCRPVGDARDVVRAVPPHRHRRDHDARSPDRPAVRPPPPAPPTGERRLCDTAAVTDVDSSTPAPSDAAAPALTADDLLRHTGGRLLARSSRPIRGGAVDSRLVAPGQAVRRASRRAHRRSRSPARGDRARRRGRRS